MSDTPQPWRCAECDKSKPESCGPCGCGECRETVLQLVKAAKQAREFLHKLAQEELPKQKCPEYIVKGVLVADVLHIALWAFGE